ncbi:MAG: glycosyltransferase family 4 protein [Acidimicrobiales bacterium]
MTISVLHVAESFSAGVATAIEGYIDHGPLGLRHTVCGYRRPGVQVGDTLDARVPFIALPSGKAAQFKSIWAALHETDADVVHLHSSWGGMLGRVALPLRRPRVVYTPHCYGFDRQDLPHLARSTIRVAESILGWRLDAVGACSRNEAAQARRLWPHRTVVDLPYVLPTKLTEELVRVRRDGGPDLDGPLEIAAVGRVGPQKDPAYFAAVADHVCTQPGEPVRMVWIGGGDADGEDALRRSGVDVTGWITRGQATARLSQAHAYLHTAAWEGLPLTLLEAATLRLPMVLRRIPALEEVMVPTRGFGPASLAASIADLRHRDRYEEAVDASRRFLDEHTPDRQRVALADLYGL